MNDHSFNRALKASSRVQQDTPGVRRCVGQAPFRSRLNMDTLPRLPMLLAELEPSSYCCDIYATVPKDNVRGLGLAIS
jgi:hypothetical protein